MSITRRPIDLDFEPHRLSPRALSSLLFAILFLCAVILAADLALSQVNTLSALYAVPVILSLRIGRPKTTLLLACACTLLIVIGLVVDRGDAELTLMLSNRAVMLFMLWVVTIGGLSRLRMTDELDASRKTLATTLESIAEGVITSDVDGRVTFLNRSAEQMLEIEERAAIEHTFEEIFRVEVEKPAHPVSTPRTSEAQAHGPDAADSAPIRATLSLPSGRRLYIEASRAPILDAEGAVRGHVLVFRDVTERRKREDAIARRAFRDELTGLPNRAALAERLNLEFAHARRNEESLALLYLDLDEFKQVNDTLGHAAGDEFLRAVAVRLRSCLREVDTVARQGGDEFTLLLPGIGGARDAALVASKMLDALSEPIVLEQQQLSCKASIGIALYPHDAQDPESLLRHGDEAMYRAKQLGGARYELFASLGAQQQAS